MLLLQQKCRDNMKRKADTSCNRPNQIYTAANAQLPDEVKAILPSSDTCKRVLRRARSRHHPPEPQRLQDFIVMVPGPSLLVKIHNNAFSMTMVLMLMSVLARLVQLTKYRNLQRQTLGAWMVTSLWHPESSSSYMSYKAEFPACLFH